MDFDTAFATFFPKFTPRDEDRAKLETEWREECRRDGKMSDVAAKRFLCIHINALAIVQRRNVVAKYNETSLMIDTLKMTFTRSYHAAIAEITALTDMVSDVHMRDVREMKREREAATSENGDTAPPAAKRQRRE